MGSPILAVRWRCLVTGILDRWLPSAVDALVVLIADNRTRLMSCSFSFMSDCPALYMPVRRPCVPWSRSLASFSTLSFPLSVFRSQAESTSVIPLKKKNGLYASFIKFWFSFYLCVD